MIALVLVASANAATLSVGAGQPYATIADALADAVDGDVIEVEAGTYPEALVVETDVTLVGLGGSAATILDGAGDATLTITSATVTLEGFTIDAGATRGLDVAQSTLTATDLVVRDHVSAVEGAGLRAVDSTVTLAGATFANNGAATAPAGGHLRGLRSAITLTDTTLTGGRAETGGALHVEDGALVLERVTVDANSAEDGAGVYILGGSYAIVDARFTGNDAVDEGGGLRAMNGAGGSIEASVFEGNEAQDGAGLSLSGSGGHTVSGTAFLANVQVGLGGGAGIRWTPAVGTTLTVTGSWFEDNQGDASGAAIHADGAGDATLAIDGSGFQGSATALSGGAVFAIGISSLQLHRNLFCGNVAAGDGGAVRVTRIAGGTVTSDLTNNVFAENAGTLGGAVLFVGTTRLVNNTFVGNGAYEGGHAWTFDSASETVNDLFVRAQAGAGFFQDVGQPALDWNLWFANQPADLGGGAVHGANEVFADPMLAAWSADLDCTNDDFSLLVGSPAIDAGDPSILDLDGSPSDIGAFGGPGAPAAFAFDLDGDGAPVGLDCDDADAAANPAAVEVCDLVDNNCDGVVDEGFYGAWYDDSDGDGYGAPSASPSTACAQPDGTADNGDDCDDGDAAENPSATDVPGDGVDQDCDGADAVDGTTDPTGPTDPTDDTNPPTTPDDTGSPRGDGPGDDADAGGCGCATTPGPSLAWLAGALLVVVGRRSRRRAA